jgi:hypothetical protein
MTPTHKKCLQQLQQRCHVFATKDALLLAAPNSCFDVSEPNFLATINLVVNFLLCEHHEMLDKDHTVGCCMPRALKG